MPDKLSLLSSLLMQHNGVWSLHLPESLRAIDPSHLQGLLKDILMDNSPGSRVVYESSCLEQWGHIEWDDIGWGCSHSAAVFSLLWTLTCQRAHRPCTCLGPNGSGVSC